mgnify:CR=1 FL=1
MFLDTYQNIDENINEILISQHQFMQKYEIKANDKLSFGENSLDYLGKYNLAFQIGTAIQVLLYSMFNSISPQVYKALESKNADSLVYSIIL